MCVRMCVCVFILTVATYGQDFYFSHYKHAVFDFLNH